jgi:hypothetical protein
VRERGKIKYHREREHEKETRREKSREKSESGRGKEWGR